jgi:tetratricopeptide (TPR) repeat protein
MRLPLLGGTAAGKADEEVVHKPETYVKVGDFRLESSQAPDLEPATRSRLREEARLNYQQALTIAPNCGPAHVALGRLYVALEDYPRAVTSYQKALQLDSKNAGLWNELGMCHARQKEWGNAVECLQRAVDGDSENRQYVSNLGFAQARAGERPAALATLSRVHGEAQANYLLARMLHHTHQDELARPHLIQSLTLNPNSTPARVLLDELSSEPGPMPSISPQPSPLPVPEPRPVAQLQPRGTEKPAEPAPTDPAVRQASLQVAIPPSVSRAPDTPPGVVAWKPIPLPPPPVINNGTR